MNQKYKRPESVLIIVHNERNILLLKRHKPDYFWQSPAGSLNWGEEIRAAAERELYEEAGLNADGLTDCKAANRFIIYPMWRQRYAPGIIENTEYVFCLETASPCQIVLDSNEHSEYQWINYSEALSKISSYSNQEAVQRWVS